MRPTTLISSLVTSLVTSLAVGAGLLAASPPAGAAVDPPRPAACPEQVAGVADCWTGRDAAGAFYALAVPKEWNGDLVVHAHGGPDLDDPVDAARSLDDLGRWSVMVREGYAWAGSTYRRGGYGARMAAADTQSVRRTFVARFGEPGRTLLHGQSWGGDVAAKLAETDGDAYDGVLLTNGVLAGGSRGYDYRVDLRAVYQYYCRNLPRPSEPQYPVWQGLRPGSTLTSTGLRSRLQECTGYQSAPAERTALQQRNLDDILGVTRIPERTLESHLRFSVFTFRDIVAERLDGRNPFTNRGVRYTGSHDDRALNRGVERFRADPTAARDLSWDSDLTGRTTLPTLTLHAVDDPTAFVEHESAYRETREGARTASSLVQVSTRESEHSALSDSVYAAALRSLARWSTGGARPTPAGVLRTCRAADATYGAGCFVDPAYRPASYASRVEPRPGGRTWPALTASEERRWSRVPGVGIAP
ncbi:alpha/beta hydrolase [Nocardioides marmoraquaticus]